MSSPIDGYSGRMVAGTVVVGDCGKLTTLRGENSWMMRYTPQEPVYVGLPKPGSTTNEPADTTP